MSATGERARISAELSVLRHKSTDSADSSSASAKDDKSDKTKGDKSDKTKGDKGVHLTEYDPDYEAPVVQSFTSLGNAGPAPIMRLAAVRNPAPPRLCTPMNAARLTLG